MYIVWVCMYIYIYINMYIYIYINIHTSVGQEALYTTPAGEVLCVQYCTPFWDKYLPR